jgi:NuA3 HAT complex component NTO1
LCPIKGGALKPTATIGRDESWAHIVCALLIPEVFFEDPDGREGIVYSKVPKRRWEEKCYVCKSRKGCVIDCSEPKCPLAFHVTCGLNEDVYIEYKEGKKKETIVAGFSKRHTELWDKVKKEKKSITRFNSKF